MYIQKNKKSKKYILIGIAALVVLLLSCAAAAWHYSFWPFNSTQKTNLNPPSSDEKQAGDQIKADSLETISNENASKSGDNQSPTSTSGAPISTVSVDITAANQNNPNFQIRVLIQALLSGGECKLTLTKGSSVYTATVPIASTSSTSTCAGFDVPVNKLSPGTWKAVVDVSSTAMTGQAIKDGIEIK